jgi:hypothetical protein
LNEKKQNGLRMNIRERRHRVAVALLNKVVAIENNRRNKQKYNEGKEVPAWNMEEQPHLAA